MVRFLRKTPRSAFLQNHRSPAVPAQPARREKARAAKNRQHRSPLTRARSKVEPPPRRRRWQKRKPAAPKPAPRRPAASRGAIDKGKAPELWGLPYDPPHLVENFADLGFADDQRRRERQRVAGDAHHQVLLAEAAVHGLGARSPGRATARAKSDAAVSPTVRMTSTPGKSFKVI